MTTIDCTNEYVYTVLTFIDFKNIYLNMIDRITVISTYSSNIIMPLSFHLNSFASSSTCVFVIDPSSFRLNGAMSILSCATVNFQVAFPDSSLWFPLIESPSVPPLIPLLSLLLFTRHSFLSK